MPANRVHLVRHGEVFNPKGVLYGRLDGFPLSELGQQMAHDAAEALKAANPVSRVVASPLLRTQQSADSIADAFNLAVNLDERLIEPFNIFEGRKMSAGHVAVRPHLYFHLRNPYRPSWGEPYEQILTRMLELINDEAESIQSGDLVMVTHQLPIWATHLSLTGKPLLHNPSKRRCALSSITTIEKRDGKWVEVEYRDPAEARRAKDKGAV
ncbi:MAG: histidine phosphatase family protein [Micrococcales bacterium]